MRSRFVLLVVAILLIAGFAALNWSEVIRPAPLWFGFVVADAPLGAILLGLLALALVVFALSAATMRTQTLLESRHHMKELEAQRALADKAEASRFTELRTHIDTHLRELRDRDGIAVSEMEKARLENQRELRAQLEQINRTLAARLNEFEHRLESRFERMGMGRGPVVGQTPVTQHVPVREDAAHPSTVHEHAQAQQAREQAHQAQMREEERLRDERIREERDRAAAAGDRPAESGWRRWF
ncbi:hypothetical protein [Ramlibacter pallidus]|uniref:LapA family protein n=1 Tax=Ramlibacter pallidus TaxID=2780087 RepID=A0ABR9S409_9BURK|nr:hypothetical protein [Ramlibacter pallidus]MBE7368256.1 hypothetical protein [Ramlibacter pallidus]